MVHTCNPSTLGGRGGWISWGQEFKISLANVVKPHLYWKYENYWDVVARASSPSYSGGWGRRITWTQEVEVAMSWDHASVLQPGDRVRLSQKTKNKNNNNKKERLLKIITMSWEEAKGWEYNPISRGQLWEGRTPKERTHVTKYHLRPSHLWEKEGKKKKNATGREVLAMTVCFSQLQFVLLKLSGMQFTYHFTVLNGTV